MKDKNQAVFQKNTKAEFGGDLARALLGCRRVFANQWKDSQQIARIQKQKLQRIVHSAYSNVGYYRRIFDEAGVGPDRIENVEDLRKIPLTTKAELQKWSVHDRLHRGFSAKTLARQHSSGSTGQPFTVYYDRGYHMIRNMLFLRGLMAAGYRFGRKIELITDSGKKEKKLLRWHYCSILDSPERILASLNANKPDLVYGCKTPLIRLAEHIVHSGVQVHKPGCIISTAELLDAESRLLLESVFSARVLDFYGSTEMGLVGWQCSEGRGYHVSADSVIIELLPVDAASGLSKMVMTNLDLMAMPFIRYDSGDLCTDFFEGQCGCGRTLSRIQKVEGRQVDCIKMRDGRMISPYRVTCAMEKILGVLKYQVIQTDWDDFTVNVQCRSSDATAAKDAVRKTMYRLLGNGVRIHLASDAAVQAPVEGKFRVVKSLVRG